MLSAIVSKLTYANVIATLALFVALGGVSYAAVKIPAHSVGTKQLKPASVGPKQLKPAAVAPKHLKRGAVGPKKLATGAVGSRALAAGAVGSGDLAAGSVGPSQLAPGGVQQQHLAANSVGPGALQGNAVGPDQLAPSAVTGDAVQQGAITFEHFAVDTVSPRLFAHGSSSGELGVNSGATGLQRESKGVYLFTFNRSLHGCVPVASVGYGQNGGLLSAGAIAHASLLISPDNKVQVRVFQGFTFNDVVDNDVNLVVLC